MAFSDTKQFGDLITASDYNDLIDDLFTRIKGNNINEATADISVNLPVPGEGDRIFIETDTGRTLYDNGSQFVEVGLSESQINLSNLGSRSHSELTDITSDDHHTKTTDLDDLNDVTGITAFEENSSGSLPSPGTEGRIFFETDTGRTIYDDGSTFVEIGLSESEMKLGNIGNLDAEQRKITNLADPTDARDAVNKQFVDASQAGLQVKESTRVATASNSIDLTSTTNPNPVDGVNLNDGDRVLLKDQTDATENGIYDAVNATDPTTWVRSDDFDEDSEAVAGAFVFVEEGSDNKNEGYVVKTNDPITLGTTEIEWVQFSGLGQVVAGDGIDKSGDILNVRMPLEDDATEITTVSAIDFGGNDFLVTDDTDNTATVQLSNDSLTVAGNTVSLGGSITPEVTDFTGNNGTSGQFLQTDGTNLSFESVTIEQTATVSSNFITSGQTTVFADVSSNTLTVTLATSDAEDGRKVRVVDKAGNAGSNNITINTEGIQTINGETSAILNSNFEALTFQSDGQNWFIVSRMAGGGSE
jgi:hypothetical protein